MSEMGILRKSERMFPTPDQCGRRQRERAGANTLTLLEVAAAFVVLAVGLLASTLTLCLEVLWKRFKHDVYV